MPKPTDFYATVRVGVIKVSESSTLKSSDRLAFFLFKELIMSLLESLSYRIRMEDCKTYRDKNKRNTEAQMSVENTGTQWNQGA